MARWLSWYTAAMEPNRAVRPPAPLWRRAGARLVDALTVFFLLWLLVVVRILWFMDDLSEAVDPDPWGRAFVATVLFTVLVTAYDVVFTRWDRGQTPGRDLFDVRVVPAGATDEPVPLGRAVVRSLVPCLAFLVPPLGAGAVVWLVAAGPAVVDPRRRALHDLLAGTAVVTYDRDAEEVDALVDDLDPDQPPP